MIKIYLIILTSLPPHVEPRLQELPMFDRASCENIVAMTKTWPDEIIVTARCEARRVVKPKAEGKS